MSGGGGGPQLAHETGAAGGRRTADVLGAGAGEGEEQVRFSGMLLAERTLAGLREAGFARPSPVQLLAVPPGKCGFNLLLEAKSGTGKTAVFTVIALELLNSHKDAEIMILAPTREIAAQITDVIKTIGSHYKDLVVEVVMGGLPTKDDIEKFANKRKVSIIVGSPGRLRNLIENKHISTSSVRLFVLDEADKLMEQSFQADINYIFSTLPNNKQVIMSSATYPEELKKLVHKYMNKCVHVKPDTTTILLGISQKITTVNQHSNIVNQTENRYKELLKIFQSRSFKQCLIFCNYQARAEEICKKLKKDAWPAHFLHGKQEQTDRLDALKTLQEYKCRILVTTDLAARGIDASNVDLIINFEPPREWTTYLHRIGRAGRYGSYGMAISILAKGKEFKDFKALLKAIGKPLKIHDLWTDEEITFNQEEIACKEKEEDVKSDKQSISGFNIAESKPSVLWDIINGIDDIDENNEDHNEEKVIEAFDKLVASYEETELETFEDLEKSYQNANIEDCSTQDIKYNTIDVEKIFFKLDQAQNGNGNKSETNDELDCDGKYNGDASNEYESNHKDRAKKFYNKKKSKHPPFVRSNTYTVPQNEKVKIVQFHPENEDSPETNNEDPVPHSNYKSYKNEKANKRTNKLNRNTESVEETYYDDEPSSYNREYTNHKDISSKRYSQYKKYVNNHKYIPKEQSDGDYSDSESESGSESESDKESATSESDSSIENVRWSLTKEEGKKLYKRLKTYEHQIRLSQRILAARNYEIFTKQLAVRKAQIETMVYIQEMTKMGLKKNQK